MIVTSRSVWLGSLESWPTFFSCHSFSGKPQARCGGATKTASLTASGCGAVPSPRPWSESRESGNHERQQRNANGPFQDIPGAGKATPSIMESGQPHGKTSANTLWWKKTLASPVAGSVIGLIGVATGIVFYFAGSKEKQPVYFMSRTEVVANNDAFSSRLNIQWDGASVPNVCVTRISLWNAGREPIDTCDFTASDPIRIVSSKPIHFLYAQEVAASRSTLKVGLPSSPVKAESLDLSFSDDVFEKDDGVMVKIVYSGLPDTHFSVRGRVKGTHNGFAEIPRGSLRPGGLSLSTVFAVSFSLSFAPGTITQLPDLVRLLLSGTYG